VFHSSLVTALTGAGRSEARVTRGGTAGTTRGTPGAGRELGPLCHTGGARRE
jgi:hypothetical protein